MEMRLRLGTPLRTVTRMKKNAAGSDKILIFGSRTHGLIEFEKEARAAKRAGFTHIQIALLSERTDFRGEDQGKPLV
ncbi:MAG: hypothetical protein O3A51_02185 [Verrucomicrobia bacterium]|nr:hypothetical protein [Verrucomicrobiota bacterium]